MQTVLIKRVFIGRGRMGKGGKGGGRSACIWGQELWKRRKRQRGRKREGAGRVRSRDRQKKT